MYPKKNLKIKRIMNNEYIENYTKTILTIIGCNIRTMRKLRKYTIMELADMSKLSTKYLQAVENGKRNISITKIYSIAKAMEVPITMFFSDIDLDKTKKVFEMFNRLKKL